MNVTSQADFDARCTGCEACANSCPASAIRMRADEDGFLYPAVDGGKCTGCGACTGVCPLTSDPVRAEPACRYGYARDAGLRRSSSSGGIFSLLAESVIEQGGVVYGAVSAENAVAHTGISSTGALAGLRGSKYTQSRIGDTFQLAESDLNAGRPVLFSGTPCQIAGLRRYLKRGYERLLTVDFVCHGVPSPLLYAEMLKKNRATAATFREKPFGWHALVLRLYRGNRLKKTIDSLRSFYFLSFLYNLSLRKSCYFCRLPGRHASDITLGDHWTTGSPEDKGESIIAVNTDAGDRAVRQIEGRIISGPLAAGQLAACFLPHHENDSYNIRRQREFYTCLKEKGYADTERFYLRGALRPLTRSLPGVLRLRVKYWLRARR